MSISNDFQRLGYMRVDSRTLTDIGIVDGNIANREPDQGAISK